MNFESVPASISVLTRLKTETRPQHDAIEAALDLRGYPKSKSMNYMVARASTALVELR